MTDLNALIAKEKGRTNPFDNIDYLHDANLYMGLFGEMPNPGLRKHGLQWYCCPNMNSSTALSHIAIYADTIGEAVCRAWLAWKGVVIE